MSELTPQSFLNLCEAGDSSSLEQYHHSILQLPERQRQRLLRKIHEIDPEDYNMLHPIHLACVQDNLDLLIVLTQVFEFDLFQDQSITVNLPTVGYIPKRSSPIHTCIRASSVSCFLYLLEQCAILTSPGQSDHGKPSSRSVDDTTPPPTLGRLLFPRDVHSITPLLLSILMNVPFYTYHICLFFYKIPSPVAVPSLPSTTSLPSETLIDEASSHFAVMPKKTIKYNPAKLALVVSMDKLTIPLITRLVAPYHPANVLSALNVLYSQTSQATQGLLPLDPSPSQFPQRSNPQSSSRTQHHQSHQQQQHPSQSQLQLQLTQNDGYPTHNHSDSVTSDSYHIATLPDYSIPQQKEGSSVTKPSFSQHPPDISLSQFSLDTSQLPIGTPSSMSGGAFLSSSMRLDMGNNPLNGGNPPSSSSSLSTPIDPLSPDFSFSLFPSSVSYHIHYIQLLRRYLQSTKDATQPDDQQLQSMLVDSISLYHALFNQDNGHLLDLSLHPLPKIRVNLASSPPSSSSITHLPISQVSPHSAFIHLLSDNLPTILSYFQSSHNTLDKTVTASPSIQFPSQSSVQSSTQSPLEQHVMAYTPHINTFLFSTSLMHFARSFTPIMGSIFSDSKLADDTDPLSVAAAFSPQALMLLFHICERQVESETHAAIQSYFDDMQQESSQQQYGQNIVPSSSSSLAMDHRDITTGNIPVNSPQQQQQQQKSQLRQSSSSYELPSAQSFHFSSFSQGIATQFPPLAHLLFILPHQLRTGFDNPWARLLLKVNSYQWNFLHHAAYLGNTESLFIILQYYRYHYNAALSLYQRYLQLSDESDDHVLVQQEHQSIDNEDDGDFSMPITAPSSPSSPSSSSITYDDLVAGLNTHTLFLSVFYIAIHQQCNASHVLAGNSSSPLHICCRHTPPHRPYPDIAMGGMNQTPFSGMFPDNRCDMDNEYGINTPHQSSSQTSNQSHSIKYLQHPYRDRYIQSFLLLLEMGVNVNAQDSRGLTVLHCICIQRDIGLLRLLLDYCVMNNINLEIQYVSEIALNVPITHQVGTVFTPPQQLSSSSGSSATMGQNTIGRTMSGTPSFQPRPSTPSAAAGTSYSQPFGSLGGSGVGTPTSSMPPLSSSNPTAKTTKVDIPRFSTAYQICRVMNWIEGCELLIKYALMRALIDLSPTDDPITSSTSHASPYGTSSVQQSFQKNLHELLRVSSSTTPNPIPANPTNTADSFTSSLPRTPSKRRDSLIRSLSVSQTPLSPSKSHLEAPKRGQREPTPHELYYYSTSLLVPDPQIHATAFEWYMLHKATQERNQTQFAVKTHLESSIHSLLTNTTTLHDTLRSNPILSLFSQYYPSIPTNDNDNDDGGSGGEIVPPEHIDHNNSGESHINTKKDDSHDSIVTDIAGPSLMIDIDSDDDGDGCNDDQSAHHKTSSQLAFALPPQLHSLFPMLVHQVTAMQAPLTSEGNDTSTNNTLFPEYIPLLAYINDFYSLHMRFLLAQPLQQPRTRTSPTREGGGKEDAPSSLSQHNPLSTAPPDMNASVDHISFLDASTLLATPSTGAIKENADDSLIQETGMGSPLPNISFLQYLNTTIPHSPSTPTSISTTTLPSAQPPSINTMTTTINSPLYSYYTLTSMCYSDLLTTQFIPHTARFLFNLCSAVVSHSHLVPVTHPHSDTISSLQQHLTPLYPPPPPHHYMTSSVSTIRSMTPLQLPLFTTHHPLSILSSGENKQPQHLSGHPYTTIASTALFGRRQPPVLSIQTHPIVIQGLIPNDFSGAAFLVLNGMSHQHIVHTWLHTVLQVYSGYSSTLVSTQSHDQHQQQAQGMQVQPTNTGNQPHPDDHSSTLPQTGTGSQLLQSLSHTPSTSSLGSSLSGVSDLSKLATTSSTTPTAPTESISASAKQDTTASGLSVALAMAKHKHAFTGKAVDNDSHQSFDDGDNDDETKMNEQDDLVIGSYRHSATAAPRRKRRGEGKRINAKAAADKDKKTTDQTQDKDQADNTSPSVDLPHSVATRDDRIVTAENELTDTSTTVGSLPTSTTQPELTDTDIAKLKEQMKQLMREKLALSEQLEQITRQADQQQSKYKEIISRQRDEITSLEQSYRSKINQVDYLQSKNAELVEQVDSYKYSQPVMLESGLIVSNARGGLGIQHDNLSSTSSYAHTTGSNESDSAMSMSIHRDGGDINGDYDPMSDTSREQQGNRERLLKKKLKGKNSDDEQEKKSSCCCCCCCCC